VRAFPDGQMEFLPFIKTKYNQKHIFGGIQQTRREVPTDACDEITGDLFAVWSDCLFGKIG